MTKIIFTSYAIVGIESTSCISPTTFPIHEVPLVCKHLVNWWNIHISHRIVAMFKRKLYPKVLRSEKKRRGYHSRSANISDSLSSNEIHFCNLAPLILSHWFESWCILEQQHITRKYVVLAPKYAFGICDTVSARITMYHDLICLVNFHWMYSPVILSGAVMCLLLNVTLLQTASHVVVKSPILLVN